MHDSPDRSNATRWRQRAGPSPSTAPNVEDPAPQEVKSQRSTSSLVAALDETHPDGDRAREVLDGAGALIVSPVLLSELDHVTSAVLGRQAAHQAIDDIRHWARQGRAVLPEITADVLDTAQAVRDCYASLDLDLADAVHVALAERFRTNAVLTLDRRDFRAVRPLTHHESFQVLPDDV